MGVSPGVVGAGVAVGLGCGISVKREHFGHFPFFPAAAAETRTSCWQPGHKNSIMSELAAGVGPLAGVDGAALVAGEEVGIGTTAAQEGHFPFFPAADPGTRTSCPHFEQGNSISSEAEGVAGAGVTDRLGADGICWIEPHCGHFPFLPAVASGVRISVWHFEQ